MEIALRSRNFPGAQRLNGPPVAASVAQFVPRLASRFCINANAGDLRLLPKSGQTRRERYVCLIVFVGFPFVTSPGSLHRSVAGNPGPVSAACSLPPAPAIARRLCLLAAKPPHRSVPFWRDRMPAPRKSTRPPHVAPPPEAPRAPAPKPAPPPVAAQFRVEAPIAQRVADAPRQLAISRQRRVHLAENIFADAPPRSGSNSFGQRRSQRAVDGFVHLAGDIIIRSRLNVRYALAGNAP